MQIRKKAFIDVEEFSRRDRDYTSNSQNFTDFIQYKFDYSEFERLIKDRSSFKTDRKLLCNVLKDQYQNIESSELTLNNIASLESENSFTITTAHQPSLLTGPLYYIYKILSAVKLSRRLSTDYPSYNFIPVFVLGAEDHDFEEINHFHLFGKKLEWENSSSGAVGRYTLEGLDVILEELSDILGENSRISDLQKQFRDALSQSLDYADFSFRISHILFDQLGLVILRMDDERLKKSISHIIKEEIFENPSQNLIEIQQDKLDAMGYGKQAHARMINLFYHCEQGRKRIVQENGIYQVLDSDINFDQDSLLEEIENNPGNFSPNVITRPLFQEYVLPNLVYIGGGGELAYWMERITQFHHFGIPFPMLVRRTSALICPPRILKQIEELGLSLDDFFMNEHQIIKKYLQISDQPDYALGEFEKQLDEIYKQIEERIKDIDPTLVKTCRSELSKAQKSVQYLESKLKKSIKQKEEVSINRIRKIREKLFPSGLQERHDNILEYLNLYGISFLNEILEEMDVFDKSFKIIIPER